MSNKLLGNRGESIAEEFLRSKGYIIIGRNFRNRLGEIDLIAKDRDVISFVEVKTRQSLQYGQPFESVHYYKRRKLSLLALSYLKLKFNRVDVPARFEVVSITFTENNSPQIHHIKHAFDLTI